MGGFFLTIILNSMRRLIKLVLTLISIATLTSCVLDNHPKISKSNAQLDKISGLRLRRTKSVGTDQSRSGFLLPSNKPFIVPDNPELSTAIPKQKKEENKNTKAIKIGVLLFPVDLDYTQYLRQQAVQDAFKVIAETGEINPIYEIPTMEDLNFDEKSKLKNHKAFTSFSDRAFNSAIKLAKDKDIELIVGAGEPVGMILTSVAPQFPKKHFLILDVADASMGKGLPNVKTVRCKVEEAAFLCGVLAVNNTAGGTFGFVGYRLDSQTLAYYSGFRAGAKHARPGAIINYLFLENPYNLGTLPPVEATQKRITNIVKNSDMVFENAGIAYIMTLKLCNTFSKRAFASVTNKDEEFGKTVITSAMVNYGPLITAGLASCLGESFSPGRVEWGLAEGVVGITDLKTIKRYLKLTDDGLRAVNDAFNDISSGQMKAPAPTDELFTRLKLEITEKSSMQAR